MLSNQGLTKQDFRAALGFIRLAESSFTAVAYYYAGLYSLESMGLIPYILPSIAIGVPIGAVLIQRYSSGDVPPDLYELRCVDRRARPVHAAQGSSFGREQSRLPRDVAVGRARHLAALSLFSVQLPMVKQAEFLASTERPGRLQPVRAQGDQL
jgi:hypothetical protein